MADMKKVSRKRTIIIPAKEVACRQCKKINEALPDTMGMDFFASAGKVSYSDMYECTKCGHTYEREQRTKIVKEERMVSPWVEVKNLIKTTPIKTN